MPLGDMRDLSYTQKTPIIYEKETYCTRKRDLRATETLRDFGRDGRERGERGAISEEC